MKEKIESKNAYVLAGIFCLLYVIIQSFQVYVFQKMPVPASEVEEFLQGAKTLHIWRSVLLLLSFFVLIYVFAAVILHDFKQNILLYTIAFTGLFIFCFLEVVIRSVELLYIQIQLPTLFEEATEEVTRSSIINNYTTFRAIQAALYFPLMFSQLVSSLIIAVIFPLKPRTNFLLKVAFALNAIRLLGRVSSQFLHLNLFDSFSTTLYLPFVAAIFVLMSIWFFKTRA